MAMVFLHSRKEMQYPKHIEPRHGGEWSAPFVFILSPLHFPAREAII